MSVEGAPEHSLFDHHSPIEDPDAFLGREWELQFAFEVINKSEFVSIVGGPKCGKSSLLRMLRKRQVQDRYALADDELLLLYFNLEDKPFNGPDEFLTAVRGRLAKESDVQSDIPSSMDLWSELEDYLQAILPRRAVFLLDNFQGMSRNPAFSVDFYDTLRALVVHHDVALLATTRKYLYLCLPDQSPEVSPFFNIFRVIILGAFTPAEYDVFISWGSERSGMPLQNWQEEIRDLGGHFPFFVQMASARFFETWSRGEGITSKDVALIRERFADEARPYFEETWRDLSEGERKVLWDLANRREPADVTNLGLLEDKGYVLEGRLFSSAFNSFVLQQGTPS